MAETEPAHDEPILDIAVMIRAQALKAVNLAPDEMTAVRQLQELPLAAAIEGTRWSKQVFRDKFDPRSAASHKIIAFAEVKKTGLDVIRYEYIAGDSTMVVLEGRTFYLVMPPETEAENTVGKILRINTPLIMVGPDAQGWSSSNPTTPLLKCRGWRDRVDAFSLGDRRAILVFKIGKSSRQFDPSIIWFEPK